MVIADKINRISALIESKVNEEDLDSITIGRKVAAEIDDSLMNLSLVFKAVTGVSLYSYIKKRKIIAAIRCLYETSGSDITRAVKLSGLNDICSLRVELYDYGFVDLERIVDHDEIEFEAPLKWGDNFYTDYLSRSYADNSTRVESTDYDYFEDLFEIEDNFIDYFKGPYELQVRYNNYNTKLAFDIFEMINFYGMPNEFNVYALLLSSEEEYNISDSFKYVESLYELYASEISGVTYYSVEGFLSGVCDVRQLRVMFFKLGLSVKASSWMLWTLVKSDDNVNDLIQKCVRSPIVLHHFPPFCFSPKYHDALSENIYEEYEDRIYEGGDNAVEGLLGMFFRAYESFDDLIGVASHEELFTDYICDLFVGPFTDKELHECLDTIYEEKYTFNPFSMTDVLEELSGNGAFENDELNFDPEEYIDQYQKHIKSTNDKELYKGYSIREYLEKKLETNKELYHKLYGKGVFVRLVVIDGKEKILVLFSGQKKTKKFNFPECFDTGGLRFVASD